MDDVPGKSGAKYLLLSAALIALLAILIYIGRSMGPPTSADKPSSVVDISDLRPGEVKTVRLAGSTFFILRPSKEQWDDLYSLAQHVQDPTMENYDRVNDLIVLWGHSTHSFGKRLVWAKKTANENHVDKWLGGFVDEHVGASFDYLGRFISNDHYKLRCCFNSLPNLTGPKYDLENNSLRIYYSTYRNKPILGISNDSRANL